MIRFSRSQVQPIGLDIGHDSVKLLQLEVADGAVSVTAAAKQALPEEARQGRELQLPLAMDAIRQLLRNHPFAGRQVIAALPREMVQIKNLRLPLMPTAEVESAVQFEARNIFPFDTDQATVRHLVAGEVRQGNDTRLEVIALAARNDEIDTYVEQLHRCGCEVTSLDFEPSAIYRTVERYIRRREDENEINVLVDIGVRTTQVIIGRGREISFVKQIDVGSGHLHDDVSAKLGITIDEVRTLRRRMIEGAAAEAAKSGGESVRQAIHDAIRARLEELAREISLCLRYYSVTFRGQRPTRLRLLGGEAGDAQLLSILSAALPIQVEAARPLYSVNTSRMKQLDRRGHLGEWAVAFGLGLKRTQGPFGARDGKSRSAAASINSSVEVVDLGSALQSADPAAAPRPKPEAANV
jgi:type IV pilus assembly protein PilM